jgi:5-formyltetrahydrofolate cyclo-ligase
LRREARARRDKLAAVLPGHAKALAGFASRLPVSAGTIVGGYTALPGEADPHLLLAALHAKGVALALPRVAAKDAALVFHRWAPGESLQAGAYGVLQPSETAEIVSPSLLLVPLLAYDSKGYRLGYGGGYYDRTLEILKPKGVVAIGVAFANQEIPSVPREAHDVPLDRILTESGLRRFLI